MNLVRSFKCASDFRLFRGHTRLRTPSKRLLRPELKDSQESQTKEGLARNRSCRHISSHKHQLRFIRGRKGHLKQHQRRLRVTRSLLSILHIPVCYRSCYVDRQPYILWVFGDAETPITPQITVCCWRRHLFHSSVPLHDCWNQLQII